MKPYHYFFLLLLLLAQTAAKATDYYVSATDGLDTDNGLTPATAWKTVSKVNGFAFQPGDRILFKAGDTFIHPMSIGRNGTATAPITVSRYGDGANPKFRGDNPTPRTWTAYAERPGFYTTPGLPNLNMVYDANNKQYLRRSPKEINNVKETFTQWINRLDTQEYVYGWWAAENKTYMKAAGGPIPTGRMILADFATIRSGGNYQIFEYLDVMYGYYNIMIFNTGCIVRNCNSYDAFFQTLRFHGASNGQAYNNVCTRAPETLLYVYSSTNIHAHHNDLSRIVDTVIGVPIVRSIQEEAGGVGLQINKGDVIIEYNLIRDVKGPMADWYYDNGTVMRYNVAFGTKGVGSVGGTNVYFYSNFCNMDGTIVFPETGIEGITGVYHYNLGINSAGTNGGKVYIFNNTLLNSKKYGLLSASPNVIFRNNIVATRHKSFFGEPATVVKHTSYITGTISDNNIFYAPNEPQAGWNMGPTTGQTRYATLLAFQNGTQQDKNSLNVNPQIASLLAKTENDFKLLVGSPAINAGGNLKAAGVISFDYKDFFGTVIFQGAATDIGGHELGGSTEEAPCPPWSE